MYRVEKIAKTIQVSMEEILRNDKVRLPAGTMVSVMNVDVSPNLGSANIYLSFFSKEGPELLLQMVEGNKIEIRHLLAAKVRSKMRRVPEIYFYLDTFVRDAFKLDDVLKNLS